MSPVPVAGALYALEDDENSVQCPDCGCWFIPVDHGLDLRPGTMYAVHCPRCNHGMLTRRLQEALGPDDVQDSLGWDE